jgi:integrase
MLLPIVGALRSHILSLANTDDPRAPLHPRAYAIAKRQTRSGGLSNQFALLLAAAGLRSMQAHQSRGIGRGGRRSQSEVSFHSLRHSTVSILKNNGVPQAVVQELVGHDSAQMSAHYTHVGREALEKAAAALPAL